MATTLVATALHGKHSIKTKNQCSCYEKRMNEQRNISLQGRSLAFSHTVGRAYGERGGPVTACIALGWGFASAFGAGDAVDSFFTDKFGNIFGKRDEDY